jgi:hypothetical protein
MPKAYSCDLRERVIEAVEAGASRREVSRAYHVHPEFGWFCPSLSLRRKLRIAVVTLAFLPT